MMRRCWQYAPDLIPLNYRINLGPLAKPFRISENEMNE